MRVSGRAVAAVVMALALAVVLPGLAFADDDSTVVVTRPGVVYHKIGGSDIRGQGVQKSLSEAQAAGYTPCRVCFAKEIASSVKATPPAGAGSVASSAHVVHVGGPGKTGVSVSQPFGVKAFPSGRVHPETGFVRNPYDEPMTVKERGREQGAYGEE
ncbi:MAG TPA: hypothetical protein VNL37_01465 [Candidatus Polarisedimenticolia bacterium]|nr:hypothetical protein [Candidatus Polarisedimenticolia bacterium]